MKIRIEVINKETYEITNVMYKTFGEYSEWLKRAVRRGYDVTNFADHYVHIYCFNDEEKNNFRAYEFEN